MKTAEQIEYESQQDLERLANFRLMDDDFLTKCFEGNPACAEFVLRIVLDKDDLIVKRVDTQVFVENILDRSVRLDILAVDGSGKYYNIEIQRADHGAGRKRARYNSSMMDARLLDKSKDFSALPETYVIFITEHDVLKKGLPVYHIDRVLIETGELFNDEAHIIYVNGEYKGNDAIGRLMHDFLCKKAADMNYKVLADRMKFFKESKEGIAVMCKAMEDMRKQAADETQLKNIKNLMETMHFPVTEAMDALKVPEDDRQKYMKML